MTSRKESKRRSVLHVFAASRPKYNSTVLCKFSYELHYQSNIHNTHRLPDQLEARKKRSINWITSGSDVALRLTPASPTTCGLPVPEKTYHLLYYDKAIERKHLIRLLFRKRLGIHCLDRSFGAEPICDSTRIFDGSPNEALAVDGKRANRNNRQTTSQDRLSHCDLVRRHGWKQQETATGQSGPISMPGMRY